MNKIVSLGIIVIVFSALLGYSYYFIQLDDSSRNDLYEPIANNPDYDEELLIIVEFEEKNNFSLLIPLIYSHEKMSQAYHNLLLQYNNNDIISVKLKQINETNYLQINGTNNSNYLLYSKVVLDKFASPNFGEFDSNSIYLESSNSANGSLSVTLEAQNGKFQGLSGCRYEYHIFEKIELTNGWNFYPPNNAYWLICA